MRRGRALLVGMAMTTAQMAQAASPSIPAPPAGARPYERGPHDTAVLTCLDAITPALRPAFGRLDFARFIVPDTLTWPQVAAHYAAGFPPAAGWTVDRIPERQAGCRLRAWSGNGPGNGPGGGAHVAVALTDDAFDPGFRVLAVITPAR